MCCECASRSYDSHKTTYDATGTIENEFAILKRLRELNIPYAVRVLNNEISIESVTGTPVICTEMCALSLKTLVTSLWTSSRAKSKFRDMDIITRQLFACLAKCHEMGIVHRDIKLDNIMLKACEPLEIRLIDWGLARDMIRRKRKRDDDASKLSLGRAGTRYWRAPEMLLLDLGESRDGDDDEVDLSLYSAVDVWSTGIVIASMLLGGQNVFMPEGDVKRNGSKMDELLDLIRVCGTETLPKRYYDVISCHFTQATWK